MLSLSRLSQRRTPAIIAVLAILLLFIAPVVSRTLAQWHADGVMLADNEHQGMMPGAAPVSVPPIHNMAGMSDSEMMHHSAALKTPKITSLPQTDSKASPPAMAGMLMMDDFACGYCELLVHFPLVIWLFLPLIWLLFTASRVPPVRLALSFFVVFIPGPGLPRAPPVC